MSSSSKKNPHIAVVMMVKDEQKRIEVSLKSIVGNCSSLIVYDTGSTDETLNIIRNFCNEHKVRLNLIEGTFVDYSTSRNVVLDYCDKFDEIDFLLLMDCNDEIRNGEMLKKECQRLMKEADDLLKGEPMTAENIKKYQIPSAFLIHQLWWSGQMCDYYNVRLFRPRCGWRYKGEIHEYIEGGSPDVKPRISGDFVLFQDRTLDDDKTGKRFHKDKIILHRIIEKNPTDTRNVYYLAQTYECLNEMADAFKYYKQRYEMPGGFWEERLVAAIRCGNILKNRVSEARTQLKKEELKDEEKKKLADDIRIGEDEAIKWCLYACEIMPRAEPLTCICEIYRDKNCLRSAYIFASAACRLSFPDECSLSVEKQIYDYTRWYLLGIVAFYAGAYTEGKEACLKAIEYPKKHPDVNEKNLKFYEEKLNPSPSVEEKKGSSFSIVDGVKYDLNTKGGQIGYKITELKKKYPKLPQKSLVKLAKAEWKKERNQKSTDDQKK